MTGRKAVCSNYKKVILIDYFLQANTELKRGRSSPSQTPPTKEELKQTEVKTHKTSPIKVYRVGQIK